MTDFFLTNETGINRRKSENALDRASRQSAEQEDARVKSWVDLGKKIFDEEKPPTTNNDF